MENFESNWKDILDRDADSSNYKPNTERIWNKIQSAQKKRRVFTPWITHIAAALAGILIGFTFLVFQNKPEEKTVKIIDSPTAIKIIHDTIQQTVIVKNEEKEKMSNEPILKEQTSLKKAVQKNNTNNETEMQKPIVEVVIEQPTKEYNAPQSTPLIVKAPPVKPIHLSDIENNKAISETNGVIRKMIASKFSTITYTEAPSPIDIFR